MKLVIYNRHIFMIQATDSRRC